MTLPSPISVVFDWIDAEHENDDNFSENDLWFYADENAALITSENLLAFIDGIDDDTPEHQMRLAFSFAGLIGDETLLAGLQHWSVFGEAEKDDHTEFATWALRSIDRHWVEYLEWIEELYLIETESVKPAKRQHRAKVQQPEMFDDDFGRPRDDGSGLLDTSQDDETPAVDRSV